MRPGARRGLGPCFPQSRGLPLLRQLKHGQDPRQQPGQEGDRHGESEHREIDRHRGLQPRKLEGQGGRQQAGSPVSQEHRQEPAGEGEHEAFHQDLAAEGEPPGAHRGAQHHLASPPVDPVQAEIGDVGAGDEQHQAAGGDQQPEGLAQVADHVVEQRHRSDVPGLMPGVELRVLRLEPAGEGLQLALSPFDRGPRSGSCDDLQVVRTPAPRGAEVETEGRPDLAAVGEIETLAQDPDHGMGRAVEIDGLPQDVRSPAETALPEAMAEDRHVCVPAVFLGAENPAGQRLLEEDRPEPGGDPGVGDPFGLVGAGQGDVEGGERPSFERCLAPFERRAVEIDGLPQDVRAPAEAALPEAMAEDCHVGVPAVFLGAEDPAGQRLLEEDRPEPGGDPGVGDPFGLVGAGQGDVEGGERPSFERCLAPFERRAVEIDGLPQDVRAPAEAALPEAMAEDCHVGVPAVFLGAEDPAGQRLLEEDRPEPGGDRGGGDPFGLVGAGQGDVEGGERPQALEGLALLEQVLDFRGGQLAALAAIGGQPDPHQAIGLLEGQRSQHHGVEEAEDHRVDADPESQGGDDQQREGRAPGQAPQAVLQVEVEVRHKIQIFRFQKLLM